MTNNPSEKIWHEFTIASKIGPSMESLNGDFFLIFSQNSEKFFLSSQLGIRP